MTRCSHPDCAREAAGILTHRSVVMPAPGFYPYCAEHGALVRAIYGSRTGWSWRPTERAVDVARRHGMDRSVFS